MKKDLYLIIGTLCLVIAGFTFAYKRYAPKQVTEEATSETSSETFKVDTATLIGSGEPSLGPTMAKVVVVEFVDPACEACRAFHPRVKKILSEFEGKIRYIVRFMPYHFNSATAIRAVHAAQQQGKAIEFLELLFNKQHDWSESKEDKTATIVAFAKSIGLDMKKFQVDFESDAAKARVQKDEADGKTVGVRGTPSFYINSTPLLNLGEEPLRTAINSALNE